MEPSVSIILPTYNRSGSLGAAISSVLTQSYEDFELIVVDDASKEDIEQLVSRIKDPRVRYVRRPVNGGAAAARNTGLAEARGAFIAFQDSDDIWLPGKLEKQMRLISSLPASVGAVTGGKIHYSRSSAPNAGPGKVACAPAPEGCLTLEEDQVGHLLRENRISVQNALFRRDCMPDRKWFDSCARANEDWEFAVRLVQRTKVYEDVEPVVLGFMSSDSISSNQRKQTMGMLRLMRHNRGVLAARKKQRARLMIDLAIALYNFGKSRRALRFMLAGLSDHPAHAFSLGASLMRRTRRALKRRFQPARPGVPARA